MADHRRAGRWPRPDMARRRSRYSREQRSRQREEEDERHRRGC